jgi:hypothetical protein
LSALRSWVLLHSAATAANRQLLVPSFKAR